jgi:hypothetical protein
MAPRPKVAPSELVGRHQCDSEMQCDVTRRTCCTHRAFPCCLSQLRFPPGQSIEWPQELHAHFLIRKVNMSTIGQQEMIADLTAAPGLPPAPLDNAAPVVYRALLSAGKEANAAAVQAGLDQRALGRTARRREMAGHHHQRVQPGRHHQPLRSGPRARERFVIPAMRASRVKQLLLLTFAGRDER